MISGNLRLGTIVKKVKSEIDDVIADKKMRPMVTLHFDDGYKSHYDIAFELLLKYGFRGTFYVIGRETEIDTSRFLSEEQIKEIADAGHEIGCHTTDHEDLTEKTDEEIIDTWLTSKEVLEEITKKPIYTHAYPYGYNDDRVINLAGGVFEATRGTKYNHITTPNDKVIGRSGTKYSLYGRHPLHNLPAVNSENITSKNVKDIIDYFVDLDEPCYLNFYMHQLFEDDDESKPENRHSRSDLEDWFEYLSIKRNEGLLDVVPFIEGVRRLNGARSIYL